MSSLRRLMVYTVLTISAIGSSPVLAFGATGHRVIGQIAENHLTDKARQHVMAITKGRPLALLTTWADEIRSDKSWDHAKPWHYMSIDDDESFSDLARSEQGDVLEALTRFERQLRAPDISDQQRWQALAFYSHFIGDIHQPLHVGRRDDKGGNTKIVNWFGRESNLHRVWDSGLIDAQQLSFTEYARFIDYASEAEIKTWQAASYLDYARESKALRARVYDFGRQPKRLPTLGYEYSDNNRAVINRRLLQAGIRLAGQLNSVFDPQHMAN